MANGLSFDEGRTIQASSCDACGTDHKIVKQFVLDDGNAHAVLFVALHGHGVNEAWIDAIFGSFDDDYADHLTFGCRVGPMDGQADPAATLVEAAIPYSAAPRPSNPRATGQSEGVGVEQADRRPASKQQPIPVPPGPSHSVCRRRATGVQLAVNDSE
jgi:hypothetical protein